MRVLRLSSVLPLLAFAAGCATQDPSVLKDGDGVFVDESQESLQVARDMAERVIVERPELFKGTGEVEFSRALVDAEGRAHVRVQQTIGGIPVFASEAVIHIGRDGEFDSVTDGTLKDVVVDLEPSIDSDKAVDNATIEMGGFDAMVGEAKVDMQILRHGGADRLTYRVQLEMRTVDDEPSMPVVFVDAKTGEVVYSYDNLQTSRNRNTYTSKNRQTLPGTLLRSEGGAPNGDWVVDLAHDNAGYVYDYYAARHNRDSFDAAGGMIKSSVHYSRNYVNAFWNGTQMVYGDGDGTNASPLVVLDVVGHEITHAVTERSSGLVYSNESGALNEAMSDIFGAAIEAFRDGAISNNTWLVGEECWTPGTPGDALRNMADPAAYGDYDYYPTRYTGTSDNGGVHWNSGIANLAFKLAVTGGTHPRGKTSVNVPALSSNANTSMQMAAAIFYRANTQCMTAGATFQDAAGCTKDAAQALYGASAASSVGAAWDAVGVPKPLTWTVADSASNLSASKNQQYSFTLTTPAGASALQFAISGSNGDADLYVRYGSAPTTATYDCRSAGATSNESCTITGAKSGTYYVMINAYSAYTGLSYTASSGQ